jgi:CHAT domain-containing protein
LWFERAAAKAGLLGVRSPRLLHLATHGYFLGDPRREAAPDAAETRPAPVPWESPLARSGLALSGANRGPDGRLSALEVAGMDLWGTELVLLSACETQPGSERTGRNVAALQRGFLLAGARCVVTSLWRAPDRQRLELLEDFYRRLLAGRPRADALREAKLALKARYADPFFWGGLVCHGDPAAWPT